MLLFIRSYDKYFFYVVPSYDNSEWDIATKIQTELMKEFI